MRTKTKRAGKGKKRGKQAASLADLRRRISRLDAEIVGLLNARTKAALTAASLGGGAAEPRALAEQQAVLDGALSANAGPLREDAVRAIYREVLSGAMALGRRAEIAYLGPMATFTHQAARAQFGGSVGYKACETISDVFSAVQKGTADYGVVPIENSTEGAVTHTLDEFPDTPLKICAEVYLPISHSLLAKGPRKRIRRIYSKPEVFGQCRRWLQENMPGVELISASSTARAAETAAREPGAAALASKLAAQLYGLKVVEKDVQDLSGNATRFLVIARGYGKPTGRDKSSVFFSVKHKVGALYDALAAFKKYSINMTKIESRPSKTKAWEYFFFVDVEGHVDDPHMQEALAELSEHCVLMRVLGAYPRSSETEA